MEVLRHENAKNQVPSSHRRDIERRRVVLSTMLFISPLTIDVATNLEGMPYSRKRARNNVQHVHAQPQERYVVVLNSTEIELRSVAGSEERRELLLRFDAVLLVCEGSAVSKPLLRRRDRIVQPRGVDEGRMDLRPGSPKQVE